MSVSVRELYDDEEARESDRDSAIESAAGSDLSDGGRGGDKEEGLQMSLPRQKSGELSLNPSVTSDLSTHSLNEEQFEDYGEGEDADYSPVSPEDETHANGFSDLGPNKKISSTAFGRVHELEEQLKEQEARADQVMDSELRRHRDALNKLERDKNTQIEMLNNRVQQLEVENTEMLVSMNRLKTQTEKLDEVCVCVCVCVRILNLIEELRRELEHSQLYKLEAERLGRIRRSSISFGSDNVTRTRENELEQEVKRLKQENQRLREQNEDLNGQILSMSLHEAKNLISTQTKAQSLAAEIENASRDQLMEALKEQEDINVCLRQYMDKIILSILDHNPSILEIKY
ncbi:Rab11 family-interacting protein 4A [Bagarius yarrelli]|uniref:Rab11 family-interacting protein 4A n=1 Tax=Bagarius yarrelli TaxID=175774 RepID=A0A556VW47_BAGYA|nr:Rab11 family-interacting protein 4A [Bagarius yarrelli]